MSQPDLRVIPLNQVRENEVALRSVNHDSEQFLELCDSIRNKGILNSLSVREKTDVETGESYYELVDGLHRFSAAKEVGLEEIPVQIYDMDDADVLDAQIIANVQRVETKPSEYTKQLLRILSMNPLMTETELASRLNKSPYWIKNRLALSNIKNQKVNELIDNNNIPLTVAYNLARLPDDEQVNFLEQAQTGQPDIVIGNINSRLKEIKDSRRKGQGTPEQEFQPVAHQRSMKDIKTEINERNVIAEVLAAEDADTPEARKGFLIGLRWTIHRDVISEQEQREKFEDRQRKKAEQDARKKAERERKKAEKEAEKAKAAEAAVKEAEEELEKLTGGSGE